MCARKKTEKDKEASEHDLYFEDAAVSAAAELAAYLMKEQNMDIEHVIRHYDVNGGTCPAPFVFNNSGVTWKEFKDKVMEFYSKADTGVSYHVVTVREIDPPSGNAVNTSSRQAENGCTSISGLSAGAVNNMGILEEQLKEMYANVCLNHKMQEKQADIYSSRYEFLQTCNILLSAVTSAGIISVIFANELWWMSVMLSWQSWKKSTTVQGR